MIQNPTEEQLRTLKGIVYLIRNKVNDKIYIGKTFRRFVDRYFNCKWWAYPSNKYFKNSIKKYGIENFELIILEHGITDNQELLNIESSYIRQYNSLFPKGYNFLEEKDECKIFTEEMRLNIARAGCKGKTYKIKEIQTGEIIEYTCPKEIIDKYGVKDQNLRSLFEGKIRRLKGICLPETNPEQWSNGDKLKKVVDQHDNKYEFYNVSKFERENNCPDNGILNVILDNTLTTKSKDGRIFRLGTTLNKSKINNKQKYKQIILTKIVNNEDFIINVPEDIKIFCHRNSIDKREIYTLTSGKQKTSHGFKLKEVIYL